ncbi:MAG: mercury methylation ferredoxin HgcB [Spirochaetia bacterium]|jgi:NAD-dependent dihydropyrimidine dehydrogenase PreA subunit
MKMRYLMNGDTLKLDSSLCTGCGECREVCPHGVFEIQAAKAVIVDRESCMECGACMKNCAAGALTVKAGVGCAGAIIKGMLQGTEPTCGCDGSKQGAARQGCC